VEVKQWPNKEVGMFIQVIRGRTSDASGFKGKIDEWKERLMPDSIGYIGSTGGVADDGTAILVARFESEDAARQNSNRPEQDAWWAETSKYFDDDPTFADYTDVEIQKQGGSDDAGFVQVIQGRVKDLKRARELDEEFSDMGDARPDLIGSVTGYSSDGDFTTVAYFTSEKEAREGESKEMPPEMQEGMKEWMSLMDNPTYIDLRDPWLTTK
jgi:hypothetical protein